MPGKSLAKPSFGVGAKNHRITSLRLFVAQCRSQTLFSLPDFVFEVALLGFIRITFENKNSCLNDFDHQILGIMLNTCYEASLAETTIVGILQVLFKLACASRPSVLLHFD